ncbi:unnamed protein product [Calypogeia fissa]
MKAQGGTQGWQHTRGRQSVEQAAVTIAMNPVLQRPGHFAAGDQKEGTQEGWETTARAGSAGGAGQIRIAMAASMARAAPSQRPRSQPNKKNSDATSKQPVWWVGTNLTAIAPGELNELTAAAHKESQKHASL